MEVQDFSYPVGVMFRCVRCARCCRDTEKRVRKILVSADDLRAIVLRTGLKVEEFSDPVEGQGDFTRSIRKTEGRCVFLRGNVCRIYRDRPLICRFYPFFLERLGDSFRFGFDADCPGIGGGRERSRDFFAGLLALATGSKAPAIEGKRQVVSGPSPDKDI
jgi:hypothetical protein